MTAETFTGGSALGLVAYQAGSVVSRELVQKKTGSVTVFAFDKDQGLSEHTAPFDALVQVLDGVAEITVGGVPHRLGKDEMILMPANVPHALKGERVVAGARCGCAWLACGTSRPASTAGTPPTPRARCCTRETSVRSTWRDRRWAA
jgi:quercetin dioxygenase-like cupin family protein